MQVAAIEDKASIRQGVGEDPPQGEGEDPQAETQIEIKTTCCGMKNRLQEEEEEARSGKKMPGGIIKHYQDIVEIPQTIEVRDIVMWGNTTLQTMVQRRGREALALEDIRRGTSAQEMIKKEEKATEISVQVIEETEVTEVTERAEMVGGTMATTDEKTAQGP